VRSPSHSPPARVVAAFAAVSLALVLQVSVFPHLAWQGIVPDLVLLVVVGAALAHGAEFAIVLGFAAGLLLDLAPPADHVAGRWALALMVVGYVAGRMRTSGRPSLATMVGTAAACSFVGTSVFAMTGILLRDSGASIPGVLQILLVALLWDVVLAPLLLPVVAALFARAEPDRALA
jgi:rod shape-determining protein MreD